MSRGGKSYPDSAQRGSGRRLRRKRSHAGRQRHGHGPQARDSGAPGVQVRDSVQRGPPRRHRAHHGEGYPLRGRTRLHGEALGARQPHCSDDRVELRVHPALLESKHLLANVSGVNNAVLVSGDETGEIMFYGRGAGQRPTASAVVSDMIAIAQDAPSRREQRGSDLRARPSVLPIQTIRIALLPPLRRASTGREFLGTLAQTLGPPRHFVVERRPERIAQEPRERGRPDASRRRSRVWTRRWPPSPGCRS
jgi:hypothetical protein